MEILDIMTQKAGLLFGQYFTVNTAAAPPYVTLSHYGAQAEVELDNSSARSLIAKGDNLQLVTAGFALPEGFCLATPQKGTGKFLLPKMSIYFYPEEHTTPVDVYHHKLYPILGGTNGTFFIPFCNFEYLLNIFINVNSDTFYDATSLVNRVGVGAKFGIYMGMDEGTIRISMVNSPSSLNASEQSIMPFIKIVHNNPLS
jgi:hypothetical protein